MKPRTLRLVLFGIALLCWIAVLMHVALRGDANQWDVEVYYYSAKAFTLGLNPYDPSNLCALAGKCEPERAVPTGTTRFPFIC